MKKGIILMSLLFTINCIDLFSLSPWPNPYIAYYQKIVGYREFPDRLPQKIDADNSTIVYSGKIDFTNIKAPLFSHAGVSIKTIFEGSGVDIILEESGNDNYYLIFIDQESDIKRPLLLHPKKGKYTYTIARDLNEGPHTIEIFKRTESNCGVTVFHGFALQKGKNIQALEASNLYQRNMLFIGDSITAGYGNDRVTFDAPFDGFDPRYENNYNAYGAITARNLKSNYQTVCYSGIGMYRGYGGECTYTMPRVYRLIAPGSSKTWDPNDYIPDVIVINLGSNDYFSEANGTPLNDSLFKEAYVKFLKEIRSDYPEAQIVCVVGCMVSDFWPEGRKAKTRLLKVITDIVTEFNQTGDQRVHCLELNVSGTINGDDSHPTTPNHIEMAKKLEKFCRKMMKW